jgi:glycosyltransferase involved in cell wall biosynthesis
MRICYIVHSQSHFAAPYIDHFARRGHEIHLVSFTRDPLPNAVNHHPLPEDCDPTKSPLVSYVRAIPQVRRLVRRIAPDLVHAHFLTSNGLVATASGFHPLVVSARGSDVHNSLRHPARRALIRWVVQHADLVNPVSAELAAKIATLGVPPAKMLCLSQGIEAARFEVARRPAPDGVVRLICTRKLHRPYQPQTIVAALARLARQCVPFHMTFAADGRDLAALRSEVAKQGLADRVRFLGGYAPSALPGLLASADVYVSASLWDGTSPALLEAMAAGVYPVVTDCSANREWLSGSGDGLLFPPDDVDALTAALARAIADRGAWDVARARNRTLVRTRADRERNLEILGAHYERLIGARGRVAASLGRAGIG